jgi:hypothetical protein
MDSVSPYPARRRDAWTSLILSVWFFGGLLLCLLTRDAARAGSEDDFLLPDVFPFDKWGGSQKDYAAYLGRLEGHKPVANAPLKENASWRRV